MKELIVSHYGESVTIAPNSKVNEPGIFFICHQRCWSCCQA